MRLREIAKRRGLKVNEYGVFRVDDDVRIAGGHRGGACTRALGMECRRPRSASDAARSKRRSPHELPDLVTLADIRGDLHAHTTSTDAKSTLEENRAMAAELGYEYVAVTDHAYDLRMVRGLDVEQLEEQWAHVDRLNADGDGPRVLKGIELNIGADGVSTTRPRCSRASTSASPRSTGGCARVARVVTRRLLEAMENPYVDIIGHLHRADPRAARSDGPRHGGRAARRRGRPARSWRSTPIPTGSTCRTSTCAWRDGFGVRFSLGTDAHRAEQMRFMPYGVATARRGWVTPDEMLNAQPLETCRAWLKRARL